MAGSKIFGMFGSDDSCSSVSASHELDLQGRTWARFQVYVFPTDRGEDGCTSKRAGLSLHAGESESVTLVELTTDRTVRGPGSEPLGEYAERTWNELVVEYDRSGETVELTYTINGDSRGTISKPRQPAESDFSKLRLDAGVDIVWWDDIEVIASKKTESGSENLTEEGLGAAGGDGKGDSDTKSSIPEFNIFSTFVGGTVAIVVVIFTLLASLSGSGSRSKTSSQRQVTEEDVRDGLEEAEESLQQDRRR